MPITLCLKGNSSDAVVGPWNRGTFDPILKLVADWKTTDIMVVGTLTHWVFHPYDGGADVILHSTDERNRLKQQFNTWLSARADGM